MQERGGRPPRAARCPRRALATCRSCMSVLTVHARRPILPSSSPPIDTPHKAVRSERRHHNRRRARRARRRRGAGRRRPPRHHPRAGARAIARRPGLLVARRPLPGRHPRAAPPRDPRLLRPRPPGLARHRRLRPPRGPLAPPLGRGLPGLGRRGEARLAPCAGDPLLPDRRVGRAGRGASHRARQLRPPFPPDLGDGARDPRALRPPGT